MSSIGFVRSYADTVGATIRLSPFDGGYQLEMTYPGHPRFLRSYDYDNDRPVLRLAIRWLNGLPWPSEDDPRVQHELGGEA